MITHQLNDSHWKCSTYVSSSVTIKSNHIKSHWLHSIAGHIGCHSDVMNIVDDACSGKRSCEFPVWSELGEVEGLSPCPQGLERYLEASYACVLGKSSLSCTVCLKITPRGQCTIS